MRYRLLINTVYTSFYGDDMKKINLFIVMALVSVLLVSCGQNNKTEFKGSISGENDLEQTQAYFINGMHVITKCPTGYYYMSEMETAGFNLLKYYDNDEQESIVLCNKPQCEHNSKDCMAYFDMSDYKAKIYYYNFSIYMIRMNGNLEKISVDGSERIILGNICNSGSSDTINMSFNGNAVYVSKENEEGINGDIKVEIYAFNLDTSQTTKIYSETAYGLGVKSLNTYSGSTYFIKMGVSKDENDLYSISSDGLYKIEDNAVKCVITDDIYGYAIDSEMHNLYYSRLEDTGIYMYNTDSGEKRKIYDNEDGSQYFTITYDGEYLWLDDCIYKDIAKHFNKQIQALDYTIYQLSKDGKLIARRVLDDDEKIFAIMHGDKDKMFMFTLKNDSIVYIDKHNIANGDIEELK